jgi:hypothetical protein
MHKRISKFYTTILKFGKKISLMEICKYGLMESVKLPVIAYFLPKSQTQVYHPFSRLSSSRCSIGEVLGIKIF